MSEQILKALMQLFAIIANVKDDGVAGGARSVVHTYLKKHLNLQLQEMYLKIFDEYVALYHEGTNNDEASRKRTSVNSVRLLKICKQINENLQQEQKILVLIQLLEFIHKSEEITDIEKDFTETVADAFKIPETEYRLLSTLAFDEVSFSFEQDEYLQISGNTSEKNNGLLYIESFLGTIHFISIASTNMFVFKYVGNANLYLNGNVIQPDESYVFDKGSSIRSQRHKPIYYSDIVSYFLHSSISNNIVYTAKDVEFTFKNSDNGIKRFNFIERSGEIIGIMGGSGVGKSTLLNVLNGNLKPQKGEICINGININEEKELLKGIIGFVPQDDLLVEELSVYQNLYYNAKLCFGGMNDNKIDSLVEKTLHDLDLYEIKDLTVGNPLNKFISGGQRKRLNIALELIREPAVLFVDEPTSGLSSMDSDMVMDLLKEQSLKGKLIVVNIHQPSSSIYKIFDKLLIMDKGGYVIYYGNPIDAITYFKTQSNYVNAEESECLSCGNVNPEQVLQIVEAKVVDEYGKLTKNRKVSPEEWYELYKQNIESKQAIDNSIISLPETEFTLPNAFKQFKIFSIRNILSKLTNKQYLLITFLEAPLLAVILGYFSKYIAGMPGGDPNAYVFSLNENLPSYIFMGVVCSLFLGLSVSAEEIIRDRKILQREQFLNLSKLSYLNSKVVLLFIISAVQTLTFVLIGNAILEIKDLSFSYFIVLFSTSCFANMLGLNISSALNSVVTIYILIPFILVPQLLLSGVIVKFDKLHRNIASHHYVSVVGDLMISRWAFEALAVNQFKNNKYQSYLYKYDFALSEAGYHKNILVTQLQTVLEFIQSNKNDTNKELELRDKYKLLTNEIGILQSKLQYPFEYYEKLRHGAMDALLYEYTSDYLKHIKYFYREKYDKAYYEKDSVVKNLIERYGDSGLLALKRNYQNEAISDLVQNFEELQQFEIFEHRIIQKSQPIYKLPDSNFGRAHFYSSFKKVFGKLLPTEWFNVVVIWLTTLILYVTLITDALRRTLVAISNFKLKND